MAWTNTHAPPLPKRASLTAALAAAVLAFALLSGCGGEDYCGAVEEHQAELTDVTASGSPAALLEALPIFRDLAEQAPDDIRDDWKALPRPAGRARRRAPRRGRRPGDVRPEGPARRTSPTTERERIEAAGAALADPAVVAAFDAVQQQAKDVCHTPLSL